MSDLVNTISKGSLNSCLRPWSEFIRLNTTVKCLIFNLSSLSTPATVCESPPFWAHSSPTHEDSYVLANCKESLLIKLCIIFTNVFINYLQVISSVVMATLFSYLRVTAAYILRREGGRRELFWCGGITQAGSFVGAILAFVLVQILHVFHSARFCG